MKTFIVFTNTGDPTETQSWTWEFHGTTTDPEAHNWHAAETAPDVGMLYVPVSQAAAAPALLDALIHMEGKANKQDWQEAYPDELEAARAAIAKAIKP